MGIETPPEIIQEIVNSLIFPRFFTPFTYRPLLHSSGHPQPKVLPIVYVCKSWYHAALPLLYRDILITRSIQLARLVNTLKTTGNSRFRLWLESIEIRDVLPYQLASVEFRGGIDTLLRTCPNLTQYANTQSYRTKPYLRPHVYPLLTPPITHLHLQWVSSQSEWMSALELTSSNLLSLFISFAEMLDNTPQTSNHLSFPQLHTLCVPQDSSVFPSFMEWDMPNLTKLLLWAQCVHYAPQKISTTRSYLHNEQLSVAFFKKFGKKLTVLDIHRNDDTKTSFVLPSRLMEHAPSLEHLIVHHHDDRDYTDQNRHAPFSFQHFQHPNVKWIDVWAEDSVEDTKQALLSQGLSSLQRGGEALVISPGMARFDDFFPNAQGIRIFPRQLLAWSHIPLLITPSLTIEPEVVHFPVAREIVDIMGWLTSEDYRDDESDPDDEDYEYVSESEAGDELSDEENGTEVGRDNAAEIASLLYEIEVLRDETRADEAREDAFRVLIV